MFDLAARLRSRPILVAPGVYDPLSALIAEQAGCEALFVSGAAVAMTQFGRPDSGLTTATELVEVVARICDRVALPVLVDGDQGFGNVAHLQRLVRGLCRAGASAVQIEDQVAVKPAAAVRARPLVSAAEMVARIKAAQDARLDDRFLVSARTDALSSSGFDDALARAEAYLEAGCDLLFVEAMHAEHADAIVRRFAASVPLAVNLLEGSAPFADAAGAQAAGFSLALFPATAMGAAAHGLHAAYDALVRDGASDAVRDRLFAMPQMNAIVGTSQFAEQIASYGDGA